MENISEALITNSKQAAFAAIEIHNKPIFPYRYQISAVIMINAWELALKAYILKFHAEINIIYEDGRTKPFEECLGCVKSLLGKNFYVTSENLERLYDYRCQYIHFYDDTIDTILYSLLAKSVQLYARFIQDHFGINLASEVNLVLLPIAFNPPLSPIDILSNQSTIKETSKEVKEFISKVIVSTSTLLENEIDEAILYTFNMALINECRTKNADIVAAIAKDPQGKGTLAVKHILSGIKISDDESAKAIKIDEETLFKTLYTETTDKLVSTARELFTDFVQNNSFNSLMRELKKDPNLYKVRYLDVNKHTGNGKGYYTKAIYEELAKVYTRREQAINKVVVQNDQKAQLS